MHLNRSCLFYVFAASMSFIMAFRTSHRKSAFQTLTQQTLNVLPTLIQRPQRPNNILWTLKRCCVPAGNTFPIYSYFHAARIMIFRCEFLYLHVKNLQYVISFFLFLNFNCSYKGSLKAVFHSAKNSDQTNFSARKFLLGVFSSFSIWRADYI